MEKRIQQKIDEHFQTFKVSTLEWIKNEFDSSFRDEGYNTKDYNNSKQFVQKITNLIEHYPSITLCKEDFNKRKRTKNNIPLFDRCIAKRANGSQCTRRKKENVDYCGTHEKGQPHGIFDTNNTNIVAMNSKTIVVHTINIKGINYFVDSECNIYNPKDVIDNILNPRKVGLCKKNEDNTYELIELNYE